MDSTTSPLILLCGILSPLSLIFKSMEKPSAVLGVKPIHRLSVIMFTHHAVRLLMLLKVKKVKYFLLQYLLFIAYL